MLTIKSRVRFFEPRYLCYWRSDDGSRANWGGLVGAAQNALAFWCRHLHVNMVCHPLVDAGIKLGHCVFPAAVCHAFRVVI